MTQSEFIPPMDLLRETFGAQNYPDKRVLVFFDELKGVSADLWIAAVRRLVLEEKFPPMMKEIRLAINQEREQRYEREKFNRAKGMDDWDQCAPFPEELRLKFPKILKLMPSGEGE